jgi:hypothetical protein
VSAASVDALAVLAGRWRARRAVAALLEIGAALAVVLALASLGERRWLVAAVLAGAAAATLAAWWARRPRPGDRALMAKHLDRASEALEESAELLLDARAPATPLGALQRARVAALLTAAAADDLLPRARTRRAARRFVIGLLVAAVVLAVAQRRPESTVGARPGASSPGAPLESPRIERVEVTVHPPAYTGRPRRSLAGLDGAVEEGSRVEWRVETAAPIARAAIVWVDGETPLEVSPPLRATGAEKVSASRIYSIRVTAPDGRDARSAYARLTVVRDEEPVVRLVRPTQPVVERDPDALGALELEVEVRDDYGIADAALVVTLASGIGEGVTFAERRLALAVDGGRARRALDLAALGLAPGSELYLVAEARDRREPTPNRGRSQPLRVRIGDPSAQTADLARGVVLARPEDTFRSQRQIIIDTERLIAEAPRLPRAEFEQRSQSLGFDQMALRLRYGELLGEETEESGIELENPENPDSPLGLIPEGLVHFHDSEATATYFSDPLRREMKRMLDRMWQAEGMLRVFDPRGALPHELEALRLLKDIQRRSRAYVPKTAGEQPVVDLERRLSADLSKVRDVATRAEALVPPRSDAEIALDGLRAARRLGDPAGLAAALSAAESALVAAASDGRLVDLAPLDAARQAGEALRLGASIDSELWVSVEAGLWAGATAAPRAPRAAHAAGSLLDRYRAQLANDR